MLTFDIATIVLVAIAGLFLGIVIMLIGFKFYMSVQYPLQFVEKDDWPEEDWVIGVEVDEDD